MLLRTGRAVDLCHLSRRDEAAGADPAYSGKRKDSVSGVAVEEGFERLKERWEAWIGGFGRHGQ